MEKPNAEDLKKRAREAQAKLDSGGLDAREGYFDLAKISKEAENLKSEAAEEYAEKFGKRPGSEALKNVKLEEPFTIESREGISWEVVPVRVGDMTSKELSEKFVFQKPGQSDKEYEIIRKKGIVNPKLKRAIENSEIEKIPISSEQEDVLMIDTGRAENNYGSGSGRGLNLGKNGWSYDQKENSLTFADLEEGIGRELEINGITYVTEKCTLEEAFKFMIRKSDKERQIPNMGNAYVVVTEEKIPEEVATRDDGSTFKKSERYPLLEYGYGQESQPFLGSFKERFDDNNHPNAYQFGPKLRLVYKLRRRE